MIFEDIINRSVSEFREFIDADEHARIDDAIAHINKAITLVDKAREELVFLKERIENV